MKKSTFGFRKSKLAINIESSQISVDAKASRRLTPQETLCRMVFLIFIFLVRPAWAAEPCKNLRLNLVPTNYNTSTVQSIAFNGRVTADTRDGGCSYFVTLDYGSSSTFGTRTLKYGSYAWPYQIAKDAAATKVLKHFPDVSSCADVLCNTLPANDNNATRDNTYQFIIDGSNPWRKYGSYSENYTLRLYLGNTSDYSLKDQKTMNVTFSADKKIDLSIVESGASFDVADTSQTMNFGTGMSMGAQKTADLILKYNAGCTLYASSQNNGSMKHSSATMYVPYALSLSGSSVNLAGSSGNPQRVSFNQGLSAASGDARPIRVTIGSTTGKMPGLYADTITFTVQSNE